MLVKNKLIIAAAGSGKTTLLVDMAKSVKEKRVLITTYTEANAEEIKAKFGWKVPANVTVQTWFSFLLEHGVRPFQSAMHDDLHFARIGFYLTSGRSGLRCTWRGKPRYWGEKDFFNYYFADGLRIYSDKISMFILKCNKKTQDAVIDRIARIFPFIFIDEVQDLAGWDLEFLRLLLQSPSEVVLVGDPRQVTYLTNHGSKHMKYRDGGIKAFIEEKCYGRRHACEIDEESLLMSHRNNAPICEFSSALFPEYSPSVPCECPRCREDPPEHQGIFAVMPRDVDEYMTMYQPQVLRFKMSTPPEMNFGESKGRTFQRVLIYPTEDMCEYLRTGELDTIEKYQTRTKFYVAVTRARHSVAFVLDYEEDSRLWPGVTRWR